ncbi:MAG: hypothetical protein J6T40_04580 [Clostridiales bacterium]|nr:hypothetical protein [Clostridiales bacterium]
MIKRCLIKISFSWIFRHKERYFLSWVSFAIISVFLIFVYSFAGSIVSEVNSYISYDLTSNQINIRNMRISENGIDKELNVKTAEDLAIKVEARGVRAIKKVEAQISRIDDNDFKLLGVNIAEYYSKWDLMLNNDYMQLTEVTGDINSLGENQVVVSEIFLDRVSLPSDSVIGTRILLDNGEEYTVEAVITHLPQGSFLNQFEVFIPNKELVNNLDYVTFDFPVGKDLNSSLALIEDAGYSYSTNSINVDRMKDIAAQYVIVGSIIGTVFVVICLICLVNSLLITINENAAFMDLLKLLGLSRGNYMFMTCFTSGMQGFIGSGIGVIFAVLLSGPLYKYVRKIGLIGTDMLTGVSVKLESCLLIICICILVSSVTGLMALFLTSRISAEAIADNELI